MRRGNYVAAGALGLVASTMRVTGLVLFPALLLDYVLRNRQRLRADALATVLPLLPMTLFVAYAKQQTGDAWAFWHVEQSASFSRFTAWPWQGLQNTWNYAAAGGSSGFVFGMEVLFGVLGLAAVIWLATQWRDIAPSLTLYAAGVWVLSTSLVYWLSVPRYLMAMVPVYIAGALLLQRRPVLRLPVFAVLAAWMGSIATLFAIRFVS